MTATSQYIVNGIPITFTAFGWGIDGVTVHPDIYNEHDAKDIANAIQYAASIWHEFKDYAWVCERITYDLNEFSKPPREEAQIWLDYCNRAIASEIFKLNDNQLIWAKEASYDLAYYIENSRYPYKHPVKETKPQRTPKPGYIYLLQAITPDNHYKIGLSKDPVTRIESMGVKLPFPVETLHTFETDDMTQTEKVLHDRFGDKRVNGEWFELEASDVEYFKSISGWFDGQVYHD